MRRLASPGIPEGRCPRSNLRRAKSATCLRLFLGTATGPIFPRGGDDRYNNRAVWGVFLAARRHLEQGLALARRIGRPYFARRSAGSGAHVARASCGVINVASTAAFRGPVQLELQSCGTGVAKSG
jgi:hypothetical protein